MGCTVKEKHVKNNRRAKSVKPSNYDVNHDQVIEKQVALTKSMLGAGVKPWDYNLDSDQNNSKDSNTIKKDGVNDDVSNQKKGINASRPKPVARCSLPQNPSFNDCGWGYCTEGQLEELLLGQLEILYNEAVSKIVELGYEEDTALKAVLKNGHCYGGMDVLTNVIHNTLAYLTTGCYGYDGSGVDEIVFTDLKQLEEYTLSGLIFLLNQVHPHLSRGDAMWCLLMSDLHLGRASTINIPMLQSPGNISGDGTSNMESVNARPSGSEISVPSWFCKLHGGCCHGNEVAGGSTPREGDCAKLFNLSPSMKSLLKRNVAAFGAGLRSKQQQNQPHMQSQPPTRITTNVDTLNGTIPGAGVVPNEACQESRQINQDSVNSMLTKFRDLSIGEISELATEEQKDEVVLTLLQQVADLEKQVNERKDWAHQKAIQAARKLSSDMAELQMLKMEREETQRLKRLKQALEDSTMKRLSEMENALRKASSQVDCANAAVRKLETENAEIRAEMEASKLNASESAKTSSEVAKREKKYLKKLLAWEKQKAKLQDEIAAGKQKLSSLHQQLVQINAAKKEAEEKLRQEINDKELALTLVEEERRSKETTEVNTKRNLESLRLRIEIEFQRHKDDLQRLEQDLSHMKASSDFLDPSKPSDIFPAGNPGTGRAALDEPEREGSGRQCMICLKDEVSVVFLPCAHQVMCTECGENYGKKGKACPCCRVPIEQRIRVFGASS